MIKETDNTTDVLENVIFTNISSQLIGQAKPSELIPVLKYVCADYGLDAKREMDFKLAKKIIFHLIKNN